jgi:hypothetical protein
MVMPTLSNSSAPTVSAIETVSGPTNETTDTITVTASAAGPGNSIANVEIFDGKTDLGATTANGDGTWSYTASGLADGSHVFSAVATDAAGNTATFTLAAVVVATQPPTVSAAGLWSGLTNQTTDTITVTASAEAVPGNSVANVEIFDGMADLGAATANGNGTWSYTASGLADGSHVFSAVVIDGAGNTATAALASLTVATQGIATANISGSWSGLVSWPLVGLHVVLTPDGKILTYGTDQAGDQGGYKIFDVWDPVTGAHTTLPNNTYVDEFCSAAQIIPGTNLVLLTGGDARLQGAVNAGIASANIYDPTTESLTVNPSGAMNFARWYPTLITLDNGQLLVLGGRDEKFNSVGYPEIFTPGNGWRTLTGAYIREWDQSVPNDNSPTATAFYPRTWEASNGKIITFADNGGIANIYAIDPSGNGHVTLVGQTPTAISWDMPAIMYAPDKSLILGDNGTCWIMDISGPTPVFTQTAGLAADRQWSNLTVLADGRVMVSGGSAVYNELVGVDNNVEIWDPATGVWTSTGAVAAVARLYHSDTILLPDATVLNLGGGSPGPLTNTNGQIYTPGYLFDANGNPAIRPVIEQAPHDLNPGQTFTVVVDNPSSIRTLALMPFGSTTHSFDMTARRVELPFTVQADGSLTVTLPSNSNLVTPGDWMLFAINNNDTPSVAATIQVHTNNPYYMPAEQALNLSPLKMVGNGSAAYDGYDDAYALTPNGGAWPAARCRVSASTSAIPSVWTSSSISAALMAPRSSCKMIRSEARRSAALAPVSARLASPMGSGSSSTRTTITGYPTSPRSITPISSKPWTFPPSPRRPKPPPSAMASGTPCTSDGTDSRSRIRSTERSSRR